MPETAVIPAFEGDMLVSNATKMSYFTGINTAFGEAYRLEISSPAREEALSRAAEDPAAEVPLSLIINASLDTTDSGEPLLVENKKYHIVITEIPEVVNA